MESKFKTSEVLMLGNEEVTNVVGFIPSMEALEGFTIDQLMANKLSKFTYLAKKSISYLTFHFGKAN